MIFNMIFDSLIYVDVSNNIRFFVSFLYCCDSFGFICN